MTGNDLSTISGVYVGSTECKGICKGSNVIWKKLPYDAEIEYLEANGTQIIDTGVKNNSSIVIDTKMAVSGSNCLSGVELNTSNRFKWGCSNSGYIYYGFGGTNKTSSTIFTLDNPCTFHMEQGNQYVKDSSDTTLMSSTVTFSSFSTRNIPLFRCYSNSSYVTTTGTHRIYYCNISGTDVSIQLIPVRVGNVGYMYDKVSGQLYGNAGSGSFTLGPDVALTIPTA